MAIRIGIPPQRYGEEIPSLNGLRALSILLVIIGHAVDSGEGSSFGFKFLFQHAGLGVRVFFVISGYLITTLLLREKVKWGHNSLKLFYIRRGLRILPAFYAFVLCVVILDRLGLLSLPSHNLLYVLTYTVNFTSNGTWWTGHLWSLSVEEQFYVLWPIAIRFLRLGICISLAVLAVVAGILIRTFFTVTGVQLIDPTLRYAFPFVSGAVAMGCLLALGGPCIEKKLRDTPAASGAASMLTIVLVLLLDTLDLGALNRLLTIISDFLLTFLVACAIFFPKNRMGRLLNSRPLIFFGKLSYSLYLWQQLFFQHYANWVVNRFPWNLAATLMAASGSYFLLERPFLALRRRFRRRSSSESLSEVWQTQ